MKLIYASLLCLSTLRTAPAQTSSLRFTAPALGLTYDSALKALRPLVGIPGAATLGAPLELGFPVSAAAIAPRGDFALVIANGGPVSLVLFRDGGREVVPVDRALAAPDRIAFSPDGLSAVLSRRDCACVQLLAGLPDRVSIRDLDTAALPGVPTVLAAGNDGTVLVRVDRDADDSSALFLLSSPGSVPLLLPASTVAASFGSGSELVTAAGDGAVWLVRDPGIAAAAYRRFDLGRQVSNPIAIQVSADGRAAYIADRSGAITALDLQTGSASMIACDCVPTALQLLQVRRMFRLNDASDRPLWLLDASAGEPRLWFVPAAPDSSRSDR